MLDYAIVARAALPVVERRRMLELMRLCYDNVAEDTFYADLEAKQSVIVLRERGSGVLRGFSTLALTEERFGGRTIDLLFSGDTVIHPDHWGQKALQRGFIAFTVRRLLLKPWRPLYWLLITKGYKTYMLLVNNFPRAIPRYDAPPWPEAEAFLRDWAARRWPQAYDPTRGVLEFREPHDSVRPAITPIDGDTARHPHVRYFEQRNPGHTKGDELVCLAHMRLRDLVWSLVRAVTAQKRLGRSGRPEPERVES